MWILVSYNRCLYQEGDWREDHFAEVENGMFIVYRISKAPSGTIARVKTIFPDDLELNLQYEDEGGASRNVTILAASVRTRDLLVKYLSSDSFNGSSDTILFECVIIKSPTQKEDPTETTNQPPPLRKRESIVLSQQQQHQLQLQQGGSTTFSSKKRESIVLANWDNLTAKMGSWYRRLFKICGDGSISYHEAIPVACISLSSASSLLCVESSPKSYSEELNNEIFGLTILSNTGESVLPKVPSDVTQSITNITRRLSRVVGSFSKKSNDSSSSHEQSNDLLSCVTIGTTSRQMRDNWFQQIQLYSSWFAREYLSPEKSESLRMKVILKGWCWKKGQMSFSAWKLRYFVLLSTRELIYSEAEVGTEPLGVIDLKKKREVRWGKSADRPQGFEEIIELETTSRTWYISPQAQTRGEHERVINRWIEVINSSDENFEKHHSQERPPFSYSKDSFFIPPSRVDLEESPPIASIKLQSWQRLTGNVPPVMLSPSPSKAEFLLSGVVSGDVARRRSILGANSHTHTVDNT